MKILNRILAAVLLFASIGAGSAFGGGYTPPQQEPRLGNGPIPNQYIITLRKAPAGSYYSGMTIPHIAADLTARHGGMLQHVYEHAMHGFSIHLTPQQAQLLAQNPMVQLVEQDQVVHAVGSESNATWGIDRIDQRSLPLDGIYNYPDQAGSGVNVYVIDTGINPNHSEFTGRVGTSQNFVTPTIGSIDPTAWTDCAGHGTHVSGTAVGTVWGVAKKATVHAIRVLNCQGSGTISDVIAGIDWVANNHVSPAVANMSLGGGASPTLDTAVNNAIGAGVTMVVAAGNSNANACNYSPAEVPNAITVGATTNTDAVASYSNRGTCVDVFAPGTNITSANYANNTGSVVMSGTSMATPHVTGTVALYLGNNNSLTPAQVHDALINDASSGKLSGTQAAGGVAASPNLLVYTGNIGNSTTDNPPTAAFTYNCNALACTFNGTSSSDDHGINAWAWDFGDSSSGSGSQPSHSYASAGSYTVKLTVTDTANQTNSTSKSVSVSTTTAPCTDCTKVSGNLGTNGTFYQPSSSGFSSGGGTFSAHLRGPSNADFDLYLDKLYYGFYWVNVASSTSNTSNEDISYSGSSGTYRWRVHAYSGSGAFDFYYKNP